jgi:hypothetical protein
VLLRYAGDNDQMLKDRDAFAAVGADLAIVSLAKNLPPSCVNDVAHALERADH